MDARWEDFCVSLRLLEEQNSMTERVDSNFQGCDDVNEFDPEQQQQVQSYITTMLYWLWTNIYSCMDGMGLTLFKLLLLLSPLAMEPPMLWFLQGHSRLGMRTTTTTTATLEN